MTASQNHSPSRISTGPEVSANAKIADTANRWGFWQMGQFAADYRGQFGELPSVTLVHR